MPKVPEYNFPVPKLPAQTVIICGSPAKKLEIEEEVEYSLCCNAIIDDFGYCSDCKEHAR